MFNEKNMNIYDYSLGAAGVLLMVVLTVVWGVNGINPLLFIFLIISEVVIDKFMIYMGRVSISLATVVDLSAFITMGLIPTLWVKSISIFVGDYISKKKPLGITFLNIGTFILAISAGGAAYNTGIGLLNISGSKSLSIMMLPPTLGFIMVNLVVNYICISIHITIINHMLLKKVLSEGILWDFIVGIISIPLSLIFADIYLNTSEHGFEFAMLFMLPVMFTCFTVYLLRKIVFANKQLKALSKVALAINSFLDLDKIYNVVFDTIASIVNYNGCYIFGYDPENESMIPMAYRTDDEQECLKYIDLSSPIFKRAAEETSGFIINNIGKSSRGTAQDNDRSGLYKSCIIIPMRRLNKCEGCIGIFSYEQHAFLYDIMEFLTVLSDQAAIAIENAKLFRISREQAITDNLTYLYNQRYFYKYLDRKAEEYSVRPGKMSLIMFDIDFFKRVNDEYGHVTGDQVLKEVAMIIKNNVRKNDIVSRYGGEEFTVVLPDTGAEEAYVIAERVRVKVEDHIFAIDQNNIRVTVSGGISEYPRIASSITELVNYADRAMYVGAKFNGRNKIKIYDSVIA